MPHSVRFSRTAREDLQGLTDWIVSQASAPIAHGYIELIRARCESLAEFPHRGAVKSKRPLIRSLIYRRSATILYTIVESDVVILRVIYRGRDIQRDIESLS